MAMLNITMCSPGLMRTLVIVAGGSESFDGHNFNCLLMFDLVQ